MDVLFDLLKVLIHWIKIWYRSQYHLRKAKKQKDIVELIISTCIEEENKNWSYTDNRSGIIWHNETGISYHCQNTDPVSITLMDAFHIPLIYHTFVEKFIANSNSWPTGVEYTIRKGSDFRFSITVKFEIDYNDSPKEYFKGSLTYINELQLQLNKQFNSYKSEHPIKKYNVDSII